MTNYNFTGKNAFFSILPKTEKPLVSFLIPTYRTPLYMLREMLDSVSIVARKYGKCEIILHDDGSGKPEITALLKEFQTQHQDICRLSVIEPNGGIALARQILFERSKGKYLINFDADDIMLDFDLTGEIDFLEKHPDIGFTYSLKYFFEEHDGVKYYTTWGGMPPSAFYSSFSLTAAPNAVIIRKSAILETGGCANLRPGALDDVTLFSRINDYYAGVLRPEPRILGRCFERDADTRHAPPNPESFNEDLVCRLNHQQLVANMLMRGQLPPLPAQQVLAIGGKLFALKQRDNAFIVNLLTFLTANYPDDFGLQNIFLNLLLQYGRFDEFERRLELLRPRFSDINAVIWLYYPATEAAARGHRTATTDELIRRFAEINVLPPQVTARLQLKKQ